MDPAIQVSRLANLRSVATAGLRGLIAGLSLLRSRSPRARPTTFSPTVLSAASAVAKLTPVSRDRPTRVQQRDGKRSPDGASGPLHARVEPTSQYAPGLGIVPGGEQMSRRQGGSEGGRGGQQQRAAPATTRPSGGRAKGASQRRPRAGRARGQTPRSSWAATKDPASPRKAPRPLSERGAEEQANGQ